jgi:hypothetical protein
MKEGGGDRVGSVRVARTSRKGRLWYSGTDLVNRLHGATASRYSRALATEQEVIREARQ